MDVKIGKSHLARKALFRRGVQQRSLSVEEIEEALPPGSLTSAERWLLYYSLRAAEIEIVGDPSDALGLTGLEEEAGEPR
ncbi:hypothetical protein [Vulgatibacter incomptus]|uniref:RNA polymerase sigma factor 70 region 1.1 domain-containing protein n=1 Tax=Vulgatibacter incomptus TaxID=1391653 RepID=A0A0K1PDJ0_9BACT|nr:hypothetical protein [Vulgatibacter incomptus]AKU91608.1 hypothetical protein AKJ08_1995 [Vulgatibacter incomptus]